jgi:hypothetical protein
MARVYMLANIMAGKERFVRDTLRGTKGVTLQWRVLKVL